MYSSYRRRLGGSFYHAFFWTLVGFVLGQVVRLDIDLHARPAAVQPVQNTVQQTL